MHVSQGHLQEICVLSAAPPLWKKFPSKEEGAAGMLRTAERSVPGNFLSLPSSWLHPDRKLPHLEAPGHTHTTLNLYLCEEFTLTLKSRSNP